MPGRPNKPPAWMLAGDLLGAIVFAYLFWADVKALIRGPRMIVPPAPQSEPEPADA